MSSLKVHIRGVHIGYPQAGIPGSSLIFLVQGSEIGTAVTFMGGEELGWYNCWVVEVVM